MSLTVGFHSDWHLNDVFPPWATSSIYQYILIEKEKTDKQKKSSCVISHNLFSVHAKLISQILVDIEEVKFTSRKTLFSFLIKGVIPSVKCFFFYCWLNFDWGDLPLYLSCVIETKKEEISNFRNMPKQDESVKSSNGVLFWGQPRA